MRQTYPIAVFEDRYHGVYSGGAWIAVASCNKKEPRHDEEVYDEQSTRFQFAFEGTHAGDIEAGTFGSIIPAIKWIAVGKTSEEAINNLRKKMEEEK